MRELGGPVKGFYGACEGFHLGFRLVILHHSACGFGPTCLNMSPSFLLEYQTGLGITFRARKQQVKEIFCKSAGSAAV